MDHSSSQSLKDSYDFICEKIYEKAVTCDRDLSEITLIAISKGYSLTEVQELYRLGHRHFGENRLLEGGQKISALPDDCIWHFIGHLQSNKLSKILPLFSFIHSVDSFESAQKISQVSERLGFTVSVLLQVNTSGEVTKQGLNSLEWENVLDKLNLLPNLQIVGLMTMAPFTQDEHIIRMCFRKLTQLKNQWKGRMKDPQNFHHLSMGMSNDYLIAIEEGATLLRIGSALFKTSSFPKIIH